MICFSHQTNIFEDQSCYQLASSSIGPEMITTVTDTTQLKLPCQRIPKSPIRMEKKRNKSNKLRIKTLIATPLWAINILVWEINAKNDCI